MTDPACRSSHPSNSRQFPSVGGTAWRRRRVGSSLLACVGLAVAGCGVAQETPNDSALAASRTQSPGDSNVVEVISTGMSFDAPDTIPSGWTTFRFRNETADTHFVILEKMPLFEGDQKGLADSRAELVPVFQNLMDSIAGTPIRYPEAGYAIPPWFGGVVFAGGTGLVGPGLSAVSTVRLEPGTYVIECYMKTDGVFHSVSGMLDEIIVMEAPSGESEPEPTLRVTVSSTNGIDVSGTPSAGRQTIAVHFADQVAYSNALGHDVHLARLDESTDLADLGAWMNSMVPGEFETPAPVTFLGGVQDMPAGSTGYFEVNLEPGRYAFISEVPDPAGEGMLHTFTVSAREATAQ